MFGKRETDVLVAGAGPVGMLTALSLAEHGVGVRILDAQWRTTARSYALALHPGSLALLDRLGLADPLVARGYRVDTLAFYEGPERRAEVSFAELATAYPFLLVVPQSTFENLLEERLRSKKLGVEWNHRLGRLDFGETSVTALVQRLGRESVGYAVAHTDWVIDKEIEVAAQFVVGTDGHHSLVRRALGADFPTCGDGIYLGIFEFDAGGFANGAEPRHEVRVVLDGGTVHVLWPLGGGCFRWAFQIDVLTETIGVATRPKSRLAIQVGNEAFPYLDRAMLERLVAERAPWFQASIGEIRWSVGVRFERRLASSFGHGRAWLAGDAAHLATPVGVHSMNVGLREGHTLAAALADAVGHGGAPRPALADYATAAHQEWRQLLGLDREVVATGSASGWVAEHAARLPDVVPASGAELTALLAQLGLELKPAAVMAA